MSGWMRSAPLLWLFAAPVIAAPTTAAPLASVDLATARGADTVEAVWRYHDATLVATTGHAPDAEGQPVGASLDTFDLSPRAGVAGFDDSDWPRIEPTALAARRGKGRVSFGWYRLTFRIPETLAGEATRDRALLLHVVLDDYAEVWVDGELARAPGQQGGSVIAGWNAPNRIVLTHDAEPGRTVTVAIFAINGPVSAVPANFVWIREARLELQPGRPGPFAYPPQEISFEIERLDPALDHIVPANPKAWKLAEGFVFTEGPVWTDDNRLLFSDPNANRIYAYRESGELEVLRERSGYAGADIAAYTQPGSNGLALDPAGDLLACEHGNRRISRTRAGGEIITLADRYEGKRLNSPNDLTVDARGDVYFTDPPFGLPRFAEDPRRELDVFGVYRLRDGKLELLADDLKGPNGVALAPDGVHLYVGNWDTARKVVMRYPLQGTGVRTGEVLHDMTGAPGADAIDGVEVDTRGHLYVSGPGGIWILDADGRHLGTLRLPRQVHNMAWGGRARSSLYLTAHDRLYRVDLKIPGLDPRTVRTAP